MPANAEGIVDTYVPSKRGLRVFGVGWHTTHQYSLAKLSFIERYDLVIEPWRRGFATKQRPMPPNMHYVTHFTPGYYDFAILHVDQQTIPERKKGNSITKGRLFTELKQTIQQVEPDLPIIVINHMTPFHDGYETHEVIKKIKKQLENTIIVVNSHKAAEQWGYGTTITHGLHSEEWGFDVEHFKKTGQKIEPKKEPRCVIVLSPKGMDKAYRRQFGKHVIKRLDEYDIPFEWIGLTRNHFDNFDKYRDYLAKSLVYFFPAWQSPRPRSRTEAMLSGCCVVTTPYHDAESIFNSGGFKQKKEQNKIVNEHLEYDKNTTGFLTSMEASSDPRIIENPDYTADLIRYLIQEKPEVAKQIGEQGRKYAQKKLNHQKFEKQWKRLLQEHNIWKDYVK